jgi:hypothetical protein
VRHKYQSLSFSERRRAKILLADGDATHAESASNNIAQSPKANQGKNRFDRTTTTPDFIDSKQYTTHSARCKTL